MENKKKMLRSVLAFLGLPLLMILIFALVNGINPEKSYNYSEIIDKFKNHQVVMYNLNLGSGSMEIKLKDDSVIYYTAPSADMIYSDIKNYVEEYNAQSPTPMIYDITKPVESSWLVSTFSVVILPTLILFALGWIFLRRLNAMSGEAGKQFGFGKARLKNGAVSTRKATFADVAGADEEKEELSEIVDFLKAPEKYTTMGARIPKGLLLVGPPGTGKTLLARAVAGEANVTFFSMSGSDFAEMYVGVGASRVRDLFEQAKKNSPCIVFIDEIDAVGRKRSSGSGSTASYDEAQTLNQLLVEMDGFDENQGVIIIAATNRPDILDPALLRPGRFDRQIFVGYPDVKGREEILKVHSKGKHFGDDVNLATIAKTTAGFTGADLENLVNESAILAVRRGKKEITMPEIEEATIKVSMGPEKKSKIISKEEKMHTAYHEAGHAITAFCCGNKEKVHEISIIPRGQAGGYTLYLPEKDDRCVFKKELLEKIMVALGGRAAEELILKDTSTGVSSDISKATDMAKAMVTKYGMNESLGPIVFNPASLDDFIYTNGEGAKSYSETTAAKIDDEVKKIITSCYERSKNILENNTDKLHKIAEFLITNEKMNQEQFENMMQSTQPEKNDEMQEKR